MKKHYYSLLIIAFCSNIYLMGQEEKPLSKHSKKELEALVQKQARIIENQEIELNKKALLQAELETKLKQETEKSAKQLKACNDSLQQSRLELGELNNLYQKLLDEPPLSIEVFDLFSFGYQPYRYNETEYQIHLKAAREEVIKARMANIFDLIRLLQSAKVDEERKKLLFQGFKLCYIGYFDSISQEQLTYYNSNIEQVLLKGVESKTYKEMDITAKENRWIELLKRAR